MDCSQLNLSGYHGTCSKFKTSIESNGLDPNKVNVRDDHWLGQGVYYFEDYSQAMWWAHDIASKHYNAGSHALIYRSIIETDCNEVLNLDNNSEMDKFFSHMLKDIAEIEKDSRNRVPLFTPEKVRAVYFDYYKIQNNISVIIYTFHKDAVRYASNRTGAELKQQKELAKSLGIYYSEKQICVSKKNCIKSSEMVYNEEEEVI